MKNDKLHMGFIAGLLGTLFKELGGFLSLLFKSPHTYWDYAAVLIFGRKSHNGWEICLAIFMQIFFSIALAIYYTYKEERFPTRYVLTKGAFFGGGIWVSIQAAILGFKVQALSDHSLVGTTMEFLTAIIFGVIVAWYVNRHKCPAHK